MRFFIYISGLLLIKIKQNIILINHPIYLDSSNL